LFKRSRRMSRLSNLGMVARPHFAAIERAAAQAKREAAAFLAAGTVPFKPTPVLAFQPKEKPMRKVVFGAALAAVVLLVAGLNIHVPRPADALALTAVPQKAASDIYAIESKIDVKALPNGDVDYLGE
jgi:hypothetical protein